MCDTLLCIHVYFHALNYIRVIVILMWHVCSLLWFIYIWHVTPLCSFALLPCFNSDSNELYFMYSYLIHIFWVHHVGLGHISMSNPFAIIVKSLYEPSILKTSFISFTYSRLCCHQSPKRERLKASRPLVRFRWLMMTWDYYD